MRSPTGGAARGRGNGNGGPRTPSPLGLYEYGSKSSPGGRPRPGSRLSNGANGGASPAWSASSSPGRSRRRSGLAVADNVDTPKRRSPAWATPNSPGRSRVLRRDAAFGGASPTYSSTVASFSSIRTISDDGEADLDFERGMDYKPGVDYCEEHTTWVDEHKDVEDVKGAFEDYARISTESVEVMGGDVRDYLSFIREKFKQIETGGSHDVVSESRRSRGYVNRGFIVDPRQNKAAFKEIVNLIRGSKNFIQLRDRLMRGKAIVKYTEDQIEDFLTFVRDKIEAVQTDLSSLPPALRKRLQDSSFKALVMAASSIHDELKHNNGDISRSFDSAVKVAENRMNKFQQSVFFDLTLAQKQVYAVRKEYGFSVNIAISEPAREVFESDLVEGLVMPDESGQQLLSRGQLQAVKDMERAFKGGGSRDGLAGKVEIRLPTGAGKSHLLDDDNGLLARYEAKVCRVGDVDLNSSEADIQELIDFSMGTKRPDKLHGRVPYVSIDESFFFTKYFLQKFLPAEIAEVAKDEYNEQNYVDIEEARVAFLRNLRKNGIVTITSGASENVAKAKIEELRGRDKLLILEAEYEKLRKEHRQAQDDRQDEEIRRLLNAMLSKVEGIKIPQSGTVSKAQEEEFYQACRFVQRKVKSIMDSYNVGENKGVKPKGVGDAFFAFAQELYSKTAGVTSAVYSQKVQELLAPGSRHAKLLEEPDFSRPKRKSAEIARDIGGLQEEIERRRKRVNAKRIYREDLEARHRQVYERIDHISATLQGPVEFGGDAEVDVVAEEIYAAALAGKGGFVQYMTSDDLDAFQQDDGRIQGLLEKGGFDAAVTAFRDRDGALKYKIVERGTDAIIVDKENELGGYVDQFKGKKVVSLFDRKNYIGGDYKGFSSGISHQAVKLFEGATSNDYMQAFGRNRKPNYSGIIDPDLTLTVVSSREGKPDLCKSIEENYNREERIRLSAYLKEKSKDGEWYRAFSAEKRGDKGNVYDLLHDRLEAGETVDDSLRVWQDAIDVARAEIKGDVEAQERITRERQRAAELAEKERAAAEAAAKEAEIAEKRRLEAGLSAAKKAADERERQQEELRRQIEQQERLKKEARKKIAEEEARQVAARAAEEERRARVLEAQRRADEEAKAAVHRENERLAELERQRDEAAASAAAVQRELDELRARAAESSVEDDGPVVDEEGLAFRRAEMETARRKIAELEAAVLAERVVAERAAKEVARLKAEHERNIRNEESGRKERERLAKEQRERDQEAIDEQRRRGEKLQAELEAVRGGISGNEDAIAAARAERDALEAKAKKDAADAADALNAEARRRAVELAQLVARNADLERQAREAEKAAREAAAAAAAERAALAAAGLAGAEGGDGVDDGAAEHEAALEEQRRRQAELTERLERLRAARVAAELEAEKAKRAREAELAKLRDEAAARREAELAAAAEETARLDALAREEAKLRDEAAARREAELAAAAEETARLEALAEEEVERARREAERLRAEERRIAEAAARREAELAERLRREEELRLADDSRGPDPETEGLSGIITTTAANMFFRDRDILERGGFRNSRGDLRSSKDELEDGQKRLVTKTLFEIFSKETEKNAFKVIERSQGNAAIMIEFARAYCDGKTLDYVDEASKSVFYTLNNESPLDWKNGFSREDLIKFAKQAYKSIPDFDKRGLFNELKPILIERNESLNKIYEAKKDNIKEGVIKSFDGVDYEKRLGAPKTTVHLTDPESVAYVGAGDGERRAR